MEIRGEGGGGEVIRWKSRDRCVKYGSVGKNRGIKIGGVHPSVYIDKAFHEHVLRKGPKSIDCHCVS